MIHYLIFSHIFNYLPSSDLKKLRTIYPDLIDQYLSEKCHLGGYNLEDICEYPNCFEGLTINTSCEICGLDFCSDHTTGPYEIGGFLSCWLCQTCQLRWYNK